MRGSGVKVKEIIKWGIAVTRFMVNIVTVGADLIIWLEAEFFNDHEEEYKWAGQLYTTMGEKEFVSIYSSPVSNEIIGEVLNGAEIWIDFSYETQTSVLWSVQTPQKIWFWGGERIGESLKSQRRVRILSGNVRSHWGNNQDVESGTDFPLTRKFRIYSSFIGSIKAEKSLGNTHFFM